MEQGFDRIVANVRPQKPRPPESLLGWRYRQESRGINGWKKGGGLKPAVDDPGLIIMMILKY